MWARIAALAKKEFLALLKDKKSRFVIIVPPILQLLVFGYAATYDLSKVPVAVLNEDRGQASRELVASFAGSGTFQTVATIRNESQIAPLINGKRVLMVIHIGPYFSREILYGRPAPVQVIIDGRNSNTAALVLNYATAIINRFNLERIRNTGSSTFPVQLEIRAWFNPNLESRWFVIPGLVGLLTLVVTTMITGLSVAREREHGTFDQLLVTPLRPVEILLGKALPGFIIGMGEATLIILVAIFWFDIPLRGSFLTLYTGVALFLLSGIGVGLMISSLSITQQQALLGAFLFLVPAVILSGFTTPIANMPAIVQKITLINPMRYFMIVLRSVFLKGTPFHLLIDQFWPMAVIGVLSLTAAGRLFRHRMY